MTSIRPFVDSDYAPVTAMHNRIYPHDPFSETEFRHWDETWEADRFYRERVAVTNEAGDLVGWGELAHIPDQFHPDKYQLEVSIDVDQRRQGHGSATYDYLVRRLHERGGISARGWVKESSPESVAFVTQRGFVERRREWQSRLDVTTFDPAPFAGARERVAVAGIELTTLAAAQADEPDVLPAIYALDQIISRDVPDVEAYTETSYDHFIKTVIDAPYALPEAFLLARDSAADRYVALARMFTSDQDPDMLYQGLTGVIPEYRGQGIAMALKLETVTCARALGKRGITTWNDTANRAMLRINEAMGFIKEPAEIVVVREFAAASSPEAPPAAHD